jgi:hypothetical protein
MAGVFLAVSAFAQVPTSGNVYFGYSYYNTNLSSIDRANLNGWTGSLEGKVFPWVGIVADISGQYGSQNFPSGLGQINTDVSEHNFLFGPRVSVSVGKIRPFAEVLIGASHVHTDAFGGDTSFGTAVGGGVDYYLFHSLAWRVQGDYVQTRFFNSRQDNLRLTTGLAFHF